MELPAHNNQTALLDSVVPGQSQKETTIVSAPQTSAVSACPIAQHSTDVPSGITMDAVEVRAENLHSNVHLDLQCNVGSRNTSQIAMYMYNMAVYIDIYMCIHMYTRPPSQF